MPPSANAQITPPLYDSSRKPTEERPNTEKGGPRRKEKEMTEMALRSRIAVLIVAMLLSIAGTFGTSAFLAAQAAQAQPNYTCITYLGKTYCQPKY